MTTLNIAYLAMAIGAWFAFAVVLMWATHITNPARKPVQAQPRQPVGANWNPLAG